MSPKVKFMQTLDQANYNRLKTEAVRRGITIQELIRGVLVPAWTTWTVTSVKRSLQEINRIENRRRNGLLKRVRSR